MGYTMPKDFLIEMQRGNIAGHSVIHKFGRNDSVPNGSWAIVSSSTPSGAMPSSGTAVRIKAGGNTVDVASGVGARGITVIGLDVTGQVATEDIVTSGADASLPTTTVFWRVYRAYVTSVGTYGAANTDDIVVENADGSDDRLYITAEDGQSQHGAYAIPSGMTGYLLGAHLTADASKAADFRIFVRENLNDFQAPVSSKRLKLFFDGVLGELNYRPESPGLVLPGLSDIWVEARGGGAGTEVSADFEILLVKNPSGPIRTV